MTDTEAKNITLTNLQGTFVLILVVLYFYHEFQGYLNQL